MAEVPNARIRLAAARSTGRKLVVPDLDWVRIPLPRKVVFNADEKRVSLNVYTHR
jgi:hypothetical protein